MDFNYESPITKIEQEITSQIVKTEEKELTYEVKKAIGYSIEKEELIKALQYDRQQYDKGYNDGYNANKWIPVKERLPEEKTTVLISCEDYYLRNLNPCIGWRNGQFWNTFTANGCKQILYPIAWMPLPEPYKAESEVVNDRNTKSAGDN